MKLNIVQLLTDYSVLFVTEGHKHCQPGWVQVACPFCSGSSGWHLGYNEQEDYWNCWRCGWHPGDKVLAELTGEPERVIRGLMRQYALRPSHEAAAKRIQPAKSPLSTLTLPLGTGPLGERHIRYLKQQRKYSDPEELAQIWQLQGTGHVGPYKFRIIAPIFHEGRMVSYQGRDVTGRSELKYKACPQHLELLPHKHCLYGLDYVPFWKREVIVVEGVTDVWRLGAGNAVATFGIKHTTEQVRLLVKRFQRVFVLYDPEAQAVQQAHKLASMLAHFKVEAVVLGIDTRKDPDDLTEEEVKTLLQKLSLK